MIDSRGFVIVHPNDFHIEGLTKDGIAVPPRADRKYCDSSDKKARRFLNFNMMGLYRY